MIAARAVTAKTQEVIAIPDLWFAACWNSGGHEPPVMRQLGLAKSSDLIAMVVRQGVDDGLANVECHEGLSGIHGRTGSGLMNAKTRRAFLRTGFWRNRSP